ncbi:hypothetical protein [Novipirellula artificiosorum]|uniref:hypothetical protein n=1 Tax=Novipirellula artificiosorum TaxID=2528016 RepID=UPI0011B3BAB0|nr:hypothetical protein [Novipirellula artificiosorum]
MIVLTISKWFVNRIEEHFNESDFQSILTKNELQNGIANAFQKIRVFRCACLFERDRFAVNAGIDVNDASRQREFDSGRNGFEWLLDAPLLVLLALAIFPAKELHNLSWNYRRRKLSVRDVPTR